MDDGMKENVTKKLKEIIIKISKTKPDPEDINDDTDIIEELALDSLSVMVLITYIEASFNIKFTDEELIEDIFAVFGDLKERVFTKLMLEKRF